MQPKTKKTKKSKKQRGNTTYGHGSRKKWKGSGHRGGVGMAGTGKRADQKKSLVIKLYGNKYFGKRGITSKSTKRKKILTINIREIVERFKGSEINLKDYKILGDGEIDKKIIVKAKAFTKSAKEKIEKAGGKIIVPVVKPKVVAKPKEKTDNSDKLISDKKSSSEEQKKGGKSDIEKSDTNKNKGTKKQIKE